MVDHLTVNNISSKHRLIAEEIQDLSESVFSVWDRYDEGVVYSDDILHSTGVDDEEFGLALARILGNDNCGRIYKENLENCLKILLYGNMESKVKIFVDFMTRDASGNISQETVLHYLKVADGRFLSRLGLVDGTGAKRSLKYDDVLLLFQRSERGMDTINTFCKQILRVLTKHTGNKKAKSFFQPPESFSWSIYTDDIFRILRLQVSGPRMYKAFLACLQIFLWLYNFNYYLSTRHALSFCVAKGFGLNLRVLTLILYFSMARSTLNMLHNLRMLKPVLFVGFHINLHSYCGFCTALHAIGHAVSHVVYQTMHREGGIVQSFKQRSLLRLLVLGRWDQYDSSVLDGDAITGTILLAMIIVMTCTALLRGLGSWWYSLFSNTHLLYVGWIIFIALHVPTLWPYFLSITLLMLLDRGYDTFLLTLHSTLAFSRPCSGGVTFLSIPYTQHNPHPGAYYRIKVPSISAVEWHPFSLAGSKSSYHLTFFAASSGDWTRRLYDLVSDPTARVAARVQVQGPFYAPAKDALRHPTASVLLVASGIGITPFFSVIATKVTDEYVHESDRELYEDLFDEGVMTRGESSSAFDSLLLDRPGAATNSADDVKTLRLVWTIRDALQLMFYLDYVYHLVKHQSHLRTPVVHVDVYLTGLGSRTDPEHMVAQTLFLLCVSGQLSDNMTIHFGRPNIKKIVRDIDPDEVYYCGGNVLGETVNEVCNDANVTFKAESFDTSDNSIAKSLSKFLFPPKSSKLSFSHAKTRAESYSSGYYSYTKKHSSLW
mmetsp:Transcript_1774/g.2784  ORF Transcript_1774/g.2784 Transcript_1774/m.2784 type:complete len:773 (+) Transcript_1774:196-2514(+)